MGQAAFSNAFSLLPAHKDRYLRLRELFKMDLSGAFRKSKEVWEEKCAGASTV